MIVFKKRIDFESVVYICSSLEVYISSGINFVKALELIDIGLTNKLYKESIRRILKRIKEGESISSAFSEEEELYTSVLADMLVVAEQSGELERVLRNMTEHFEKKLKIEKEVKTALLYPKVIFGVGITVFILFLDFVLPSIVSMYEGLDMEFNFITEFIINLNSFLQIYNIYIVSLIIFISIICIVFWIKKITKGKDLIHFLKIRKDYKEIKLISIINLVLESGVPIVYALERLSHSISENYTREYITTILLSIKKGSDISSAIEEIDVMSEISKSFFVSGENSGRLDKTTAKLLIILENSFSKKLSMLISKIEPISICILGFFVLILMLLVFVPMYEYMNYV